MRIYGISLLINNSIWKIIVNKKLCHNIKHFRNTISVFSTNFQKWHIIFACESSSFPFLYYSLCFQIQFICNQHLDHIFRSMLVNLRYPSFQNRISCTNIIKCLTLGDRICEDNAGCSFIIGLSNISKSFLACSVPYLQFNSGSFGINSFYFKIYTNRCHITIFESIFTKTKQNIGFAHPTISNYYQFNQFLFFFTLIHLEYDDYYINKLTFIMREAKKKREQIFEDIRKKDRDNIKRNLRDRLLQERQEQNYYPLISNVLENFMMFQPNQISLHLDEISRTISQTILTEFSDDQHDDLITDLLYLVQEHQMRLPIKLKFKRNESNYTATLIALSYKDIDEAQLSYWVNYVSEEDRQLIFLSIDSEEQQNKWVSNPDLYKFLLDHIGINKEAARSFKDIIQNCDQLSKKQIELSLSQIQKSLFFKSFQIDFEHQQLLTQILMIVTKILAAIKGKTIEVTNLINLLKKLLKQRKDLFLCNAILSYFNDFYQLFIDVFFESDAQIETILSDFDKKIKQEDNEKQMVLTMNYLLKLIYNHWRSRKMSNKMYKSSEIILNWLSKAKTYAQLASSKILDLLLNQN